MNRVVDFYMKLFDLFYSYLDVIAFTICVFCVVALVLLLTIWKGY